MTKKMKSALIVGALCLLVCLSILLVSLFGGSGEPDPVVETEGRITYTIEIKTEGGMALEGVGVYIYTDATQEELVWFAKADAAGRVTFTDVPSDSYIAVLRDVPEGYLAEATYPITGELTEIVLSTDLVSEGDLSNVTYELGDVIHDFSVTTPDGTEYTLSELLEQKEAVVLNFWYIQCQPCRQEFPYLQEAYEKYSDKIEVLALNPVNVDDEEGIAAFREELGLTFPVAQCDPDWERMMQLTAYPTTVVIDRYGTISMIHKGSVTEAETFENMFAFFSDENYEQTLVEDLESLEKEAEKAEIGTPDEPVEVGGVTSFTVTVGPDQVAYYNVYKVSGMYMQIKSDNVYVVYKGKTYYPSNGVVGMTVTSDSTFNPVSLQIGNTGDEEETFKVTFSSRGGTVNNPYSASLGEFTTNISAGNDQGVYYTYKATADGYLILENLSATSGVEYNYVLYNLNSYAQRTLEADGDTNEETGNPMVYVKVKKGQTVQMIIGTLPNSSNNYPAAKITSKLYFSTQLDDATEEEVELVTYAVTVTDADRKPVSGVFINVKGEETETTMTTDLNGIASAKLPVGTYTATLSVPVGYEAKTTRLKLTEANLVVSVKMDKVVVEYETYTVKVVDENGKPVSDVFVSVDKFFGTTDANGVVTIELEKGDYTATISVPEGYTSDATTFPFPENAAELTIQLQKTTDGSDPTDPSEPEDTKMSYQVSVVDYNGTPVTSAAVQIKDASGASVAAQKVDAAGTAIVKLEPGDYTVELAFSDGIARHYNAVELSEDVTTVKIRVATVAYETEAVWGVDYYCVYEGGTYVTLQADTVNKYLFAPTRAGVYKFTTSDPSAVISYWSTSSYPFDATSSTDYDPATNSFTLEIKESSIGNITYVIGVTGADSCVVEITRIDDVVLDEDDLVAVEWKGEDTPTSTFKLTGVTGKTFTFVDLTSDTKVVYNSADGYYHLNSASGPVVYVALGNQAGYYRWLALSDVFGVTNPYAANSFNQVFYDENGNPVRKESYLECMIQYIQCRDTTCGVYPLTDDLIYMLQQGGDRKGWYTEGSPDYVDKDGTANINQDILWMFNCCYFA